MKHRTVEQLLAVPYGRSLDDEAGLSEHLQRCPDCRRIAAEYERQDSFFRRIRIAPPPSLRAPVLQRIAETPSRRSLLSQARRLPGGASIIVSTAAVVLLVAALLAHQRHLTGTSMGHRYTIPPAVQRLAARLGVTGTPVVGDQKQGMNGPWYIWPPRSSGSGRQALYISDYYAAREWHYFNGPAAGAPVTGSHAKRLSTSDAIRIASRFLQRAGAEPPRLRPQVKTGWHATVIGGTGLCCFSDLDVISWGETTVYVADNGGVVQAEVYGPRLMPTRFRGCGSARYDGNGVDVGTRCFNYAQAARRQMALSLGGHGPTQADPQEVARAFLYGSRLAGPRFTALMRIRLQERDAGKAVYVASFNAGHLSRLAGIAYRVTVVPAFPGLLGSVWEVVDVEPIIVETPHSGPSPAQMIAQYFRDINARRYHDAYLLEAPCGIAIPVLNGPGQQPVGAGGFGGRGAWKPERAAQRYGAMTSARVTGITQIHFPLLDHYHVLTFAVRGWFTFDYSHVPPIGMKHRSGYHVIKLAMWQCSGQWGIEPWLYSGSGGLTWQ